MTLEMTLDSSVVVESLAKNRVRNPPVLLWTRSADVSMSGSLVTTRLGEACRILGGQLLPLAQQVRRYERLQGHVKEARDEYHAAIQSDRMHLLPHHYWHLRSSGVVQELASELAFPRSEVEGQWLNVSLIVATLPFPISSTKSIRLVRSAASGVLGPPVSDQAD